MTARAATATAIASPISRPPRNVRMMCLSDDREKNLPLAAALELGFLPHHHAGTDRDAAIEVGDVRIDQAEAAGGYGGADGIRPVGAVDAVDGGAEIHRAGAERIARPARHEARQIGLALDHLRRRRPVGPLGLS